MNNIKTLLQDAAHNEPSLSDNLLLKVLALKIDAMESSRSGTTQLFNRLVPEVKDYQISSVKPVVPKPVSDDQSTLSISDFRLKRVRISNIRGIPEPREGKHFGIDFSSERIDCQSGLFIGANGSGKSSLFSGLEYMYTGELSEPKLRYDESNTKVIEDKYLSNVKAPLQRYIELTIADPKSNKFTHSDGNRIHQLPNFLRATNPDSSFVAEVDIYNLSRRVLNDDIDESSKTSPETFLQFFLAGLLGLEPYQELTGILRAIQSGVKKRRLETTKIRELQEEIRKNKGELDLTKTEIDKKQTEMSQLQQNVSSISTQESSLEDIRRKLGRLSEPRESSVSDLFQQADKLFALHSERDAIVNKSMSSDAIRFFNLGLDQLRTSDDCPLCLSSKKTKSAIEESIRLRLSSAETFVKLDDEVNNQTKVVKQSIEELFAAIAERSTLLRDEGQIIRGLPAFREFDILRREWIELVNSKNIVTLDEQWKGINEKQSNDEQSSILKYVRDILRPSQSQAQEIFDKWKPLRSLFEQSKESFFRGLLEPSLQTIDPRQRIMVELGQLQQKVRSLQLEIQDLSREEEAKNADMRALDIIQKDIPDIVRHFNLILNREFEERFGPLKDTISELMKLFFEFKNEELVFSFVDLESLDEEHSETKKLNVGIKIGAQLVSPKQYLNNFRWKRFYSALSIAVALAMRVRSRINLPLVIDDEILGADASNKVESVEFFKKLVAEYRRQTPGMPFQLIVFTQDELVFDCIREGLRSAEDAIEELNKQDKANGRRYHDNWNIPFSEQTIFARQFPPNDLESLPRKSIEGKDEYWCVIGEFPSRTLALQQSLKKVI
jgi:hypothetical protein